MKKIGIVIPYFNEGHRAAAVIYRIEAWASQHVQYCIGIAVVDDGSSNLANLDELKLSSIERVSLLRHSINLGQGAALQTGITFAQRTFDPDFYVTMDSDGQHDVNDLDRFLDQQRETNADIVFGNRFGSGRTTRIPLLRKVLLNMARIFEDHLTGVRLRDAHNGYRLFTRKFAETLQIRQNRMAHATEFKMAARGFRVAEAPVNIHYSSETLKKGQSGLGSFRIIRDLLGYYFFQV